MLDYEDVSSRYNIINTDDHFRKLFKLKKVYSNHCVQLTIANIKVVKDLDDFILGVY